MYRLCSVLIVASILCLLPPLTAHAQEVDLGGRAYIDYFSHFSHPDSQVDGRHGFQYRRLYLTTDFTLSDAFSGRARLEANDGTVGPDGPVPVVKDLWLTWAYTENHHATVGVTPTPAFGIAEDVWGYRSLEKTIMDLQDVVSSRDFGLRFNGPVTENGSVRYAVMVANNSGLRPETDKYKRIYGQIEARPTERVIAVVGGDYAGYGDQRDNAFRLSAFGGYSLDDVRIGLEAYWYQVTFEPGGERTDLGASLFGRVQVAPEWEVVGRIDRSRTTPRGAADQFETSGVVGLAYQPHESVKIIPNVRLRDPTSVPATTTGRITAEINF